MTLSAEPKSVVPAVTNAAAILRLLAAADQPAGVNAIARELGLRPSSCFNILKTLAAADLVAFDLTTKRYVIGLGTVDLARRALAREDVIVAARPVMAALATRLDAAIALWRVVGGEERVTLVALAEGEAVTRIHMAVGQRQPAAGGAVGRAVMARLNPQTPRLRAAFDSVRWHRTPDFADYQQDLRLAQARGYACDIDQILQGLTTVATPIGDGAGVVRFCLSASMFSGRHDEAALGRIGEMLVTEGRDIAVTAYGAAAGLG